MTATDSQDYILNLRDRSNCSHMECVKSGDTIKVLVCSDYSWNRRVNNSTVERIEALGTRSLDGTWFTVTFTTPEGEEDFFVWNYSWLLEAIATYKPAF